MHIKIISISAKNRFLLGRGVRTVQICQQTIGVCVIDAFSSEETQKNNCFFSGRTTKVQVPLPLDPGGFNFFLIFSFDEKNFFAKWFRGFNPPSPLSGPTTKKNLFFICVSKGGKPAPYMLICDHWHHFRKKKQYSLLLPGGSRKKGLLLMAGPLRPNPPPLGLNGRWNVGSLEKKV